MRLSLWPGPTHPSLDIITRVAPHCVNILRILHAAYDATEPTCPIINTPKMSTGFDTEISQHEPHSRSLMSTSALS